MMEASSAKKSIQPSRRREAVCRAKSRSASRNSCSHIEACAAGDKRRDVGFCAATVVAASENTNRKTNKRRIFSSDVLRVAAGDYHGLLILRRIAFPRISTSVRLMDSAASRDGERHA